MYWEVYRMLTYSQMFNHKWFFKVNEKSIRHFRNDSDRMKKFSFVCRYIFLPCPPFSIDKLSYEKYDLTQLLNFLSQAHKIFPFYVMEYHW